MERHIGPDMKVKHSRSWDAQRLVSSSVQTHGGVNKRYQSVHNSERRYQLSGLGKIFVLTFQFLLVIKCIKKTELEGRFKKTCFESSLKNYLGK